MSDPHYALDALDSAGVGCPTYHHQFTIPVMGTGHSADTPIKVAPLGISSVISLIDDWLLEQIGLHYSGEHCFPYERVLRTDIDGRAKRITNYLNLVDDIVRARFAEIQVQPFSGESEKRLYFELLPHSSHLWQDYARMLAMADGAMRDALGRDLTARMTPGSIDVNLMVKVDCPRYDRDGAYLGDEYRDAMAALRGYARSKLRSSVVLSAGVNRQLISYMTEFPDFYRDGSGWAKKRIIVKVSDYRSARIQNKFLARKGLEIAEYRVESGLNCGGHSFPSDGTLLPSALREFQEKREQLDEYRPMVAKYYEQMGTEYVVADEDDGPLVTVQGGIGTHGEARRLVQDYGMDRTGWATPFLLVPEATSMDTETRQMLADAGPDQVYSSDVSPLNIPFSNLRNSSSERWMAMRAASGRPGSPCPKGFGATNTDYSERPICLASSRYQSKKLAELESQDLSADEKARRVAAVTRKACICDHLGNGALIGLGISEPGTAPVAVCPGPNIAWFDRTYSLREMVDHIYGRGGSLVGPGRPHMFAQEAKTYVDYVAQALAAADDLGAARKQLAKMRGKIDESMAYCLEIAASEAQQDENLASLRSVVLEQRERLRRLFSCGDDLGLTPGIAPEGVETPTRD